MKIKTCAAIVDEAIEKVNSKLEYYKNKQQTIKTEVQDRYPEDLYGIRWMQIYDNKSRDLADQVLRSGLYLRALYNVKEYVEEEYERKKGKTIPKADAECR